MNLPCKEIDGRLKRVYTRYTLEKDMFELSSYIYHCGDASGEVPPVLIPNTVVKLTSADNT